MFGEEFEMVGTSQAGCSGDCGGAGWGLEMKNGEMGNLKIVGDR